MAIFTFISRSPINSNSSQFGEERKNDGKYRSHWSSLPKVRHARNRSQHEQRLHLPREILRSDFSPAKRPDARRTMFLFGPSGALRNRRTGAMSGNLSLYGAQVSASVSGKSNRSYAYMQILSALKMSLEKHAFLEFICQSFALGFSEKWSDPENKI